MASHWLMEEGSFDPAAVRAPAPQRTMRSLGAGRAATAGPEDEAAVSTDLAAPPKVAVFLKPLVISNTRKVFGSAELRLDTIVAHAGPKEADLFQAKTIRYERVRDGQDLADGDDSGILVYLGTPQELLMLGVTVSRDTGDSADLKELLGRTAARTVPGLVDQLGIGAIPQVAAAQAALGAAATLLEVAYEVVRAVSPKSLGIFRANWLRSQGFGVGRHPPTGVMRKDDIALSYEIIRAD